MAERTGNVGTALLLNLRLDAEVSGLFPQATIRDASGAVVAGPLDMDDRGGGLYQTTWTPTAVGQLEAAYLTYQDAAHTIRTLDDPGSDDILVRDFAGERKETASDVWEEDQAAHTNEGTMGQAQVITSGHAGGNAVLDGGQGVPNAPHNGNNNLTTCRLRVFATKAQALAATPGAANGADGEILRTEFDAANYVAGSLTAVPEVLANFIRTVTS